MRNPTTHYTQVTFKDFIERPESWEIVANTPTGTFVRLVSQGEKVKNQIAFDRIKVEGREQGLFMYHRVFGKLPVMVEVDGYTEV
jgi:hypothetical protein